MTFFESWREPGKVALSALLVYPFVGVFLKAAMSRERVSENEIGAAVREAESGILSEVQAVVLEVDASFSVLSKEAGHASLPDDVERVPKGESRRGRA